MIFGWKGGKREGIFVKNHISRGKKFMCTKIIKTIALLTKWIAKENTSTGSCIKLVFGKEIGSITQTTENS